MTPAWRLAAQAGGILLLAAVTWVGVVLLGPHRSPVAHSGGGKELTPMLSLAGVRLVWHVGDRPAGRLWARRFVVRRKRIGFFRVGVLPEAVFENALVELDAGGGDVHGPPPLPLPADRLAGVAWVPVRLVIVGTGRRSVITAAAATWESGRFFRLFGPVTVESAECRLRAGRLDFDPASLRLVAPDGCRIEEAEGPARYLQPCRLGIFLLAPDTVPHRP